MLIFFAIAMCGAAMVVAGAVVSRRPATEAVDYLNDLAYSPTEPADEFQKRLELPFVVRVLRPVGERLLGGAARLTPRGYLARIHKHLLLSGKSASLRAQDVVSLQVAGALGGLVLGTAWVAASNPGAAKALLALVLFPFIGAVAPEAWLKRRVAERQDAIRKELPDALDLLAISAEAGLGLEAAMEIVSTNFVSPLALEFSHTLKEMELGLSRREALQNLKRRTEVPELSNFVLALTQADALGMPIGRVLHTQAAELRVKRRQWAREKAGKLPVKILGPLVLFIFPAVLVVVVGPAFAAIMKGLGGS